MGNEYTTFGNIKNALKLAWKNKILWVFALMIAGGINFSGSGNLLKQDKETEPSRRIPIQNPSTTKDGYNYKYKNTSDYVKGASTDRIVPDPTNTKILPNTKKLPLDPRKNAYNTAVESAKTLFSKYGIHFILVIISLLLGLTFTFFAVFIAKGWASSAIIQGTKDALDNTPIVLNALSNVGISKTKEIIKLFVALSLIPLIIVFFAAVIPLVLIILGMNIIAAIAGVILFIIVLLISMDLYFVAIYSKCIVVFQNGNYKQALKEGYALLRKNFSKSLKLAFGNCLVQMLVGITILSIIAIFAGAILMGSVGTTGNDTEIPVVIMILASPLVIGFIVLMTVLSGFLTTANEISWTTLFLNFENKNKPAIQEQEAPKL